MERAQARVETKHGPLYLSYMSPMRIIAENYGTNTSGYFNRDGWEPFIWRGVEYGVAAHFYLEVGRWVPKYPFVERRDGKSVPMRTQQTILARLAEIVEAWQPDADENLRHNLYYQAEMQVRILPDKIAEKRREVLALQDEISVLEKQLTNCQNQLDVFNLVGGV